MRRAGSDKTEAPAKQGKPSDEEPARCTEPKADSVAPKHRDPEERRGVKESVARCGRGEIQALGFAREEMTRRCVGANRQRTA